MHGPKVPDFTHHASNEQQPVHRLLVAHASPQLEYNGVDWSPGDPEEEPTAWSPMTGVVGKIRAGLDGLAHIGSTIIDQVVSEARDLGSTLYAAATGEPPERPGPLFQMAAGVAESVARVAPTRVQSYLGYTPPAEIAGYIVTSDGRKIPVPKYVDPVDTAEKARSAVQSGASLGKTYDAALERAKLQIQAAKERASQDQFDRTFALKERQVAQALRIGDLQERALELALERETSSSAQRALWGRPSTLAEEPAPARTSIKAIGLGLPGAPIRYQTRQQLQT